MFHKGCSYSRTSFLKSGLIAGGRASRDGKQTVFFTPLNLMLEDDPEEEQTSDDFKKPRKEHYRSKWIHSQDCLLGYFSQSTRQRTTILAKTVECHYCIQLCAIRLHLQGAFSKKLKELYSRDSRRLDLRRRLYSKFLCKCSSSNSSSKTLLKVQLPAAGKSLRKIGALPRAIRLFSHRWCV